LKDQFVSNVKAAGPRARLDQEAPGHPLGRDQIGKLELDAHQLFTQVPGLPSGLAAALPDPIDHRAHRSPLPPEIVVSALSIDTVPQMPQLADRFRRWWQVLGSDQRRLSRRFYRPLSPTRATGR
jgi:hypothetical protein